MAKWVRQLRNIIHTPAINQQTGLQLVNVFVHQQCLSRQGVRGHRKGMNKYNVQLVPKESVRSHRWLLSTASNGKLGRLGNKARIVQSIQK